MHLSLLATASLILLLSSCNLVRPDGARLSRGAAWRAAEQTARQEGIPMKIYKHQKGSYLPDRGFWCMTFEERGYFLAVGDQFAVFVNDQTGQTRIARGVGIYRQEDLNREIEKLGFRTPDKTRWATPPSSVNPSVRQALPRGSSPTF
jgi:hypothetical protein